MVRCPTSDGSGIETCGGWEGDEGIAYYQRRRRSVERTYDFVAMVLAILRWHALRSGNVIPNQGDRCY